MPAAYRHLGRKKRPFYVPAQMLTQYEFKRAAQLFVSPDGQAARYPVIRHRLRAQLFLGRS
jgi:hypothetical protein